MRALVHVGLEEEYITDGNWLRRQSYASPKLMEVE